jgi:glutamate synthase (ferredoxin)
MTGGTVVVLGPTGRNFAAGMSGGTAYVRASNDDFRAHLCNRESVDLEALTAPEDIDRLRRLIERHRDYTQSDLAGRILDDWETFQREFIKVMPVEYKRALEKLAADRLATA